jgi:hypothetical protein
LYHACFDLPSLLISLAFRHSQRTVLFFWRAAAARPGEHEFYAGCQLLAKALNEQSGLGVKAKVIQGWPEDTSVLDGAKAIVIYADGTSVVGKGWERWTPWQNKEKALCSCITLCILEPQRGTKLPPLHWRSL